MWEYRAYVEAGGLMSYGALPGELYRRSATYADRILKGAKPADLPIEQARNFELAVNLKTARALNITIPSSLLLRADHVIHKPVRRPGCDTRGVRHGARHRRR